MIEDHSDELRAIYITRRVADIRDVDVMDIAWPNN